MLKKLVKTIFATTSILTGAALSTASPSQAVSSDAELKSYTPSEITKVGVNNSGTAYEMKGLMDIAAEVQLVVDGGVVAHVKNWKTWLVVRTENSNWFHFSDDGVSESYPFLQRPHKVDVLVPLAVPHMTLAPVMVSYCNALADELRDQGKSNTEIFSQDRTVPIAIRVDQSETFVPGYNALHQAHLNTGNISGYPKINLICKGRAPTPPVQTAGAFKPPPVDFKVQDIDLFLTTFSGANTQPNAATTCKKGQIKVRLTASKAGPAKFKLWTKVGAAPMTSKVIDAWASFDGNGGYEAEYVEWVSVDKTTFMQAKAEEMISAFGKSTPWKDITLPCKDVGGGGLATDTSTQDEPLAPPAKYDGELTIADAANAKRNRCPRQGQVVFKINSSSSAPVSYRLDSSDGQSWTGTLQMLPSPFGPAKYRGVSGKTFNVSKTGNITFALKRVKGDKAYVLDFRAKQFTCIRPNVETGSNDIKVAPKPNTGNTRVPTTLVPNRLDKAKVEAAKRRREAAKKVAEAKRKREAAAKRVSEAKKKAMAEARRKRAEAAKKIAEAKRKREAAAKRKKAAEAAAKRKAAAAALTRRRAATAALARRKTVVARKRRTRR